MGVKKEKIMLLESYSLEIFNSACNPGASDVHCFAHLNQEVGDALPYLNSVLGGFQFIPDPPSVTFKAHGKLITVHNRKIAVNALKDEGEAKKIVEWLKREINDAWENRERIEPSYQGAARPQLIEILKLLPKTNCRKCGCATCMVFAAKLMDGGGGAEDCPELNVVNHENLISYLERFNFD